MAVLGAATSVGLCAAGTFVADPAFAYPPGTRMAVSAKPIGRPNDHRHQMFAVLVTNGKPGCRVRVVGGERPVITRVAANGTAWAMVDAGHPRRNTRIVAQTTRCPARERASTRVVLSSGRVHAPSRVRHHTPVRLTLSRWAPHHRISVVAVNGRHVERLTIWPDEHGAAHVRLALKRKGTWAVIVRQHGTSAYTTLRAT